MPSPRTLSEQEFNAIKDRVLSSLPSGLSEADFGRVVGPAMEQAIGEAENSPAPVEGGAVGRFLSNAGEMLNPVSLVKGVASAVAHPIDTLTNIGTAAADQYQQGKEQYQQGHPIDAAGHFVASGIPLLGPMAAQAGQQIASGDVAGGLGKGFGLVAPAAVPGMVRAGAQVLRAAPEGAAAAAEAGAASRLVDVMAPKVGANKVRFGGMAEDVAPALAKDLAADGAPWSRTGLHDAVSGKLESAIGALDAAADARLNGRAFPTQPIIQELMAKRRALTSEAVQGSLPEQVTKTRQSAIVDSSGRPIDVTTKQTRPIGQDQVPGPNAARVAQIDQAIDEIKGLGPVARYEALRRIRQAYDGPAKAKYNPSTTADFLKAQGGANGAADVTGVLRENLAKFDPETAKANADYALYKRANDVLDATAEVERVRPKVGRQIMARLTGATVGGQTAGAAGAAGGFILGPVVEAATSAGMTTKLQTAKLLRQLADAMRRGDLSYANSVAVQLKRIGRNAVRQVGNATSPNESQSQTTSPATATP